ncbi:probable chitinase 10 [Diorhabda sublineata]|uniref:probable chitinase 10 n=1 Tax=Diorhabda sublineata TaxID=1163346 RepID=UPI0024E088BF|nr:probable chitinase 10 [Diorhabda sublineata]
MRVLSSVCYLLTISYVYGYNENFSNMVKAYEEECTDGQHHYHWYPYDCQKYFSCENGKLEIEDCPSDLYWNEDIKACDVKENVDCSNIKPFPDPDCSNNETAYYMYPYDCQMFYECYGGVLYTLTCPADSLWNDKEKKCDESDNVDCSDIIPYPSSSSSPGPTTQTSPTTTTKATTTTQATTTTKATTTTQATTPTEAPTTSKVTSTTNAPTPLTTPECTYEHQYFPYPYDCSKYYECSNGKAMLMDCPPGEVWNNEVQTCDWPYNTDCVPSPSPNSVTINVELFSSENTMRVVLSICYFYTFISCGFGHNNYINFSNLLKIYDDECTDGQHHYRYYPYDCQKYFSCENGQLELEVCPDNLYWNDEVKACDIQENVDCSDIIPFPDPDCSNNETAYYFYPYDCQKFYECYGGVLYTLTCPDDSLWNDDEKTCDESDNVDCSNIIPYPPSTSSTGKPTSTKTTKTTSSISTTTSAPGPYTTPQCTYEHQYFPYPFDCTKFYMCSNGIAYLMDCPSGEFWDQRILTCDYDSDCVPSPPPSY